MIYQEKISFGGKVWYQLEWNDIDFSDFDEKIEGCKTVEEIEEAINTAYPEANFKYTTIERKVKQK